MGEGDPIRPRLESHYALKDFWTRAIGFVAVGGLLNKAHVQFLEARLIALARAAKRVPLDNGNFPGEPTLSEADRADMDVFLSHMLGMLPVLGGHAFEQGRHAIYDGAAPSPAAGLVDLVSIPLEQPRTVELYCSGKASTARGSDTSQGFVVAAGSEVSATSGASLTGSVKRLREELLAAGVILLGGDGVPRFAQDYVFSSPSTAAAVVLGRSANGRIEWKDAQGRTLTLQEAEASE